MLRGCCFRKFGNNVLVTVELASDPAGLTREAQSEALQVIADYVRWTEITTQVTTGTVKSLIEVTTRPNLGCSVEGAHCVL